MTKKHSENLVAAKARKRMADPLTELAKETRCKIRVRRARAKWRLQLRDLEHGDSLTLLLYRLPWQSRYADSDGKEHSAAELGSLVSGILTEAP